MTDQRNSKATGEGTQITQLANRVEALERICLAFFTDHMASHSYPERYRNEMRSRLLSTENGSNPNVQSRVKELLEQIENGHKPGEG